jgi:hypothetical protein
MVAYINIQSANARQCASCAHENLTQNANANDKNLCGASRGLPLAPSIRTPKVRIRHFNAPCAPKTAQNF